ncbi:MAG: dTDP-4-dehydrorhamnose 3,5-epimerase [Lentimonas sp.]|jgi:dTDP-4-dehydrorhamnose 3,5-epimerase
MKITKGSMSGLLIIEPRVFEDERGYFFESFNLEVFQKHHESPVIFCQDNESKSNKGIIRGLHFQAPPMAQGKLVRVVKGSVRDVVVDIRKSSPTYGQKFEIILSEKNKIQLYLPPGFAHGFSALEDETIFSYKCTEYYAPETERCILYNDEDLNIDWGVTQEIVSQKDLIGTKFKNINSPFS